MNLDKDDLLRNAAPGYVFVTVIFSFYVVTGDLLTITKDSSIALWGIVAGYPLGFLIQAVYRTLFHICLGEQRKMEDIDAENVDPTIKNQLIEQFGTIYNKENNKNNKMLAQWLALSLSKKCNQPFSKRRDFLMSYFHALGACSLAIVIFPRKSGHNEELVLG
ncbi:MAG: hypothetical protein HYZ83_08265 [Candidatus Omnitrophica bacterium]|nr:hypothetical protein [Candidatus Omnitrophota bacterium]